MGGPPPHMVGGGGGREGVGGGVEIKKEPPEDYQMKPIHPPPPPPHSVKATGAGGPPPQPPPSSHHHPPPQQQQQGLPPPATAGLLHPHHELNTKCLDSKELAALAPHHLPPPPQQQQQQPPPDQQLPPHFEKDSDSNEEECHRPISPGPDATPCNKEFHKSKNAIFIKLLNRGINSCSRCDLVFKPQPHSDLAKKREEREKKLLQAAATIKEEKVQPTKRIDTPIKSSCTEAQVTSTLSQHGPYGGERMTPRPYPGHDTPALRQLSEYARPHTLGQDFGRSGPYGLSTLPPHVDPMLPYRLASMYPAGSRERLELELERDKRERDARERELRERELREMEIREKFKADMEMKPPGTPGSKIRGNTLDAPWIDMRRYAYPPSAAAQSHLVQQAAGNSSSSSSSSSNTPHIPGVYPPTSLANDLLARERERLERLDILHNDHMTGRMIYEIYSQRFTNEQHIYLQRVTNECYLRSKHDRSLVDPTHLVYQFSRADPMSGVTPGGAGATNPGGHHLPALPHSYPSHPILANRDRDTFFHPDVLRAYSDPALAHQISTQAAQHEAMQRHFAMERERYGATGHLPH
ncbi:arginine-glutamic acid dipeptide repeats protein-like isoform X1 [Argonauta hians]